MRRILDTSVLISYWNSKGGRPADAAVAQAWATDVQRIHRSDAILSPVYLEFICGTQSSEELKLATAFLERFEVKDAWQIRREDLRKARQIAARVPRKRNRRQLGDCLIRALANRLRCEVVTSDQGFPPR